LQAKFEVFGNHFLILKEKVFIKRLKKSPAAVVMHATMVVHHEHKSSFASPANDVMPLYTVTGTRLLQAKHGAAQRKHGMPNSIHSSFV